MVEPEASSAPRVADVELLSRRLAELRQRIAEAALRAGRNPADVTLIAASKDQPAELLRAAWQAGQRDFGENYAREWQGKARALADCTDLAWHFIGHLQRNKLKLVLGRVSLLHSLDSMVGLDAMTRYCWEHSVAQEVLVEVNLAGEASKTGCREEDLDVMASVLVRAPGLRRRGLMTMPPPGEPEEARPFFRRLADLRERIVEAWAYEAPWLATDFNVLSMGMSQDFEVAVAEGATHVRIGTALFGARG
jgi:pyridoxal phosphate enzyme (YggS family)